MRGVEITCGAQVDTLWDGEDGAAGAAGANGRSIHWLGHLDSIPSNPKVNDVFYLEGFGVTCLWSGSSWDIFTKDANAKVDRCFTPEEASDVGVLVDSRDGQTYGWVKIGNQTWMASNLNFGSRVAGGTDQGDASDTSAQRWCYNNDGNYCAQYGALYQWHTAMGLAQSYDNNYAAVSGETQGICPEGWHVPTRAEFNTLQTSLAAEGETAGSSVFGALLGGYRYSTWFSDFSGIGSGAYWWTADQQGQGNNQRANAYYATWSSTTISTNRNDKSDYGYALRCLKNAD